MKWHSYAIIETSFRNTAEAIYMGLYYWSKALIRQEIRSFEFATHSFRASGTIKINQPLYPIGCLALGVSHWAMTAYFSSSGYLLRSSANLRNCGTLCSDLRFSNRARSYTMDPSDDCATFSTTAFTILAPCKQSPPIHSESRSILP